jgi:4-amino-4-deoxy-L-arabinose transferase-like glycosyltransferase
VAIFILAFLVRFCLAWYLVGLSWRYDTGDGYENAQLLEHIVRSNCYMPPGQYLFAGCINQLFSQPQYLLLRIATIVLSALVSVNIYRIGRNTYGTPVGAIAGYASVLSLPFIFHSWTFYGTTLAACLLSFFIVYFLRIMQCSRKWDSIAAGVFLGLSSLTRTEMLIFAPLAFFWFLVVKGTGKEYLKKILTVLLVAAVVICTWTVRNYLVCDKVVLVSSNGGVNFFIGNNPIQRGGYFPPRAMNNASEDFLLSGLLYDLSHPGWFFRFFSEKSKLYLSSDTWEHPKQLLESRFDKSTLRLFSDTFEESRLNSFMQDPRLKKVHAVVIMFYSGVISAFWFLLVAGILCSHLFWRQSYFLVGVCLVSVFVFSLFFSGANRWFVPILPCLYIIMGSGLFFLYRLPRLRREEVKILLRRNGLLVGLLFAVALCSGLFIYYPAEKLETIEELLPWNVISMGEESVRLIIMGSQLAYPVKTDRFTSDAFSVWLGENEIPHISHAGKTPGDEKFYFKEVKDLLCKNAFVLNVPHVLMNSFVGESKENDGKVTGKEIVQSLKGKIRVRYVPAWQFRSWFETGINALLMYLKGRQAQNHGNPISRNLSPILLRLRTG